MRANDCIEIMNYAGQFHKELKRTIYEFNYYRNDQSGTESLYNLYLVQDKTRKMYLNDLNDWELNNLDTSSKPIYIENDLGITYDLASHFRDLLFNAIENDKSYGYLFYLLASEKNRTEPFYQNNPIDCIPDKKLIEESIYNYQDDYPKKSLDEYLTYCDFNYSFYRKYKKKDHSNDFWFSVFFISYNLFDEARTLLFTPFTAIEIIKELVVDDENEKIFIITLVSQLLEQYNFDLSVEQVRGKKILVDEITDYLKTFSKEEILTSPETETESDNNEHPVNYIINGGVITTGSYEISELYRHFKTKNAPKELFLVDKLEISLAHYASNYRKNCDDYWETYKFDPNFFNDFIPGDLLSEFNIALHEHIKPLNSQEINRYLTTSINQFKTHTPDKRRDVFCEIYHDVYWYPNYMKYTGSSARDNYVLHVWKLFSNHFQLFQEATQNTFDIFKATLTAGSTRTIHEVENGNSIKENKSEVLKSILSRNGFLELPKVNSLSHDSQLKLIETIKLNDTPYNVALFEFIGFFKFLEFEKSLSKVAIHKKISEIFECSADTIKGNMLSLNDYSKIDKTRYTAHLHKEKVKNDYNSLK